MNRSNWLAIGIRVTIISLFLLSICPDSLPAQVPAINWPAPTGKLRVIIDADAANEVDDQWAIALALGFPARFQIEGFVAAHYGDRGGKNGIQKSYNNILEVLEFAGMKNKFPVKKGSDPITYKDQINESEGVDFIIATAKSATPGNPLWVITLGAVTDAAMAILKDPSISDRVIVLWHGRTDWSNRCWNFNASNDLKAVQVLFDKSDRFILFDTGTYLNMPMPESEKRIATNGKLGAYLHNIRKKSAYAQLPDKGFFDVGDIAALLRDSISRSETIPTPAVADDYKYVFDNANNRRLFTRIYEINREATFNLLDEALKRLSKQQP
ncbi:MAG: nucleoside hydrolase [Ferruginibacter sp.]